MHKEELTTDKHYSRLWKAQEDQEFEREREFGNLQKQNRIRHNNDLKGQMERDKRTREITKETEKLPEIRVRRNSNYQSKTTMQDIMGVNRFTEASL